MDFLLGKSVSAGPYHFHVLPSHSGISVDTSGLHLGKPPRVNWVCMGPDTLAYRATTNRSPEKLQDASATNKADAAGGANVLETVAAQRDDIVRQINESRTSASLWLFFLIAGVLVAVALASQPALWPFDVLWIVLAGAATVIAALRERGRKNLLVLYDMDDRTSAAFQAFADQFAKLALSSRKWSITVEQQAPESKRNAGATQLIARQSADLSYGVPSSLLTNVSIPAITGSGQSLFFFPDAMIAVDGGIASAVSYEQFTVKWSNQLYIESEDLPPDAHVVGQTWQYANKDGEPDRRFSNNRQIPKVLYQRMDMEAPGFKKSLHFSRLDDRSTFDDAFRAFTDVIRQLQGGIAAKAAGGKSPGDTPQADPTQSPPQPAVAPTALEASADKAFELFKQIRDTRTPAGKLLIDNANEGFLSGARTVCVYIATADGPVTGAEAVLINRMLGESETVEALNAWHGKMMANSLVDQTINAFKVLIDALSTVDAATGAYSAASDRVIVFVTALGQVVMTCDGRIDAGEAARLAQILSPLKAKALTVQLLRSLQHPATPATAAAPASKPEVETGDPLLELHNLIGLSSVKVEVETLANLAKVFTLRKTKGLPVPDFSFHLVFSGNPGTGKTTVARIVARIYKQLGLLTQGHLVEVDRSGLVANYVGQTATKVQDVVAKAMGGVLFIDEAYALSAGGQNDFGQEAIETLLKAMEDHRDNLIVIVAGYTDKMSGFLQSNPGLKSRFPKTIQFPDYTAPEMDAIFQKFCADAHYKVDDDALPVVASCLQHCWDARGADFANARDVRNIFEAAIAAQANRLGASSALTDQQLTVLTRDDIIAAQASS